MIRISEATSLGTIEIVRELFLEYGALPDANIAQHEIAGLPGEYVPPTGALLVALDDKSGAGCVALRKLEQQTCEMKRLYVRPKYRGQGMGKELVLEIIAREGARIRADEAGHSALDAKRDWLISLAQIPRDSVVYERPCPGRAIFRAGFEWGADASG